MDVLKVLNIGLLLLDRGLITAEKIAAMQDQMAAMVAEGREPTAAEWQSLGEHLKSDAARIRAVADRARANAAG